MTAAPNPTAWDSVPQYRGPLGQLMSDMAIELNRLPPERWVRRRLKRGAIVALRRNTSGRRTLVIARAKPVEGEREHDMFVAECRVFLSYMSAMRWTPVTVPEGSPTDELLAELGAGVWAAYLEPPAEAMGVV